MPLKHHLLLHVIRLVLFTVNYCTINYSYLHYLKCGVNKCYVSCFVSDHLLLIICLIPWTVRMKARGLWLMLQTTMTKLIKLWKG